MASRRKRKSKLIQTRAKIWLESDGQYVFGLGISDILKAVGQTGSIKQAARSVHKSYRHVWSRIKEAEQSLGVPLVETQVGGGNPRRSRLTEQARLLVYEYERLRKRVFKLVEKEFAVTLESLHGKAQPAES